MPMLQEPPSREAPQPSFEADEGLKAMDRRDFLLLRGSRARQRSRHYVLSCEWVYNRCLDRRLSQHSERERAIFDEEAIRLVFDDLDDQLRGMDTCRVVHIE